MRRLDGRLVRRVSDLLAGAHNGRGFDQGAVFDHLDNRLGAIFVVESA